MTEQLTRDEIKRLNDSTVELFKAYEKYGIEELLLFRLFSLVRLRHGEKEALRRFQEIGSKKNSIQQRREALLMLYVITKGFWNKAEFVRNVVEMSKKVPRDQNILGPRSTSDKSVRRYLDRALREERSLVVQWTRHFPKKVS